MECDHHGDMILLTFPVLKVFDRLTHAVTTRPGGISEGPFRTLNLGFNVGDDLDRVLRNREKVVSALGWPLSSVVSARQVHGTRVALVTSELRGQGACDRESALAKTDGLLTGEKGLLLMIKVADCVPVFLYDPEKPAVALLHAGWRGAAQGIIPIGVSLLSRTFGSRPEAIRAGIGPGIGPCCYRVGEEVVRAFKQNGTGDPSAWRADVQGNRYLDLKQILFSQLIRCGLRAERIETAPACTACEEEWFFSHRRDQGQTGRMAAFLGLLP